MAKIVDVRYGLTNLSNGTYRYVVNDNVKRGSVLTPVVEHYKSHKKFATMAVVQKSHSGGGVNAKRFEQEFSDLVEDLNDNNKELKWATTPERDMQQALKPINQKGQYINTGWNGFSDKTKTKTEVRVGNETYENLKQNQAVQNARANVLANESANTSKFTQPTTEMSYKEFFDTQLKGKKL